MNTFKLKVVVGTAQIELEGDGDLVHSIFQELRENGLGKLAIPVENCLPTMNPTKDVEKASEGSQEEADIKTTTGTSDLVDEELPTLENVVLQGTPKMECDWLLVYATYCSNQGKSLFTKDDLRAKYDETKRTTDSTKKNFAKNIKALVSSKYISAVNSNEFRLETVGLAQAKSILLGYGDDKKGKRNNSSKRKKPPTYSLLELNLSKEQRQSFRDFWISHDHSANMDKALLVAYWLKKEKGLDDFSAKHLFTMLRTIEESTSFDLAAAIRNGKNLKNYFILDSNSEAYKLHHIGEDHVKALEITKEVHK